MQKKSNAIIIWRIIFTYMVTVFHFDNRYNIFRDLNLRPGWYIAVEFFFIVSGFLLYSNFEKLSQNCKNGLEYFWIRFKKIYPFYLGGFCICYILRILVYQEPPVDVLVTHVFELFCLHGIGLNLPFIYVNNTMWYLSVMLIAGALIFHCLLKWKDNFVHFVAPIIIMITFSYLFRWVGIMDGVTATDGFFCNQALMRGLADMCLGIFAAKINARLQRERMDTWLIRILGTVLFLFVIIGSAKYGATQMDFLFALVLMLAAAIGFLPSKTKIFQMHWLQYWSELTLCIYIVHYAFSEYIFSLIIEIPYELKDRILYLGIYLVIITMVAFVFHDIIKMGIKLFHILFTILWEKRGKIYKSN